MCVALWIFNVQNQNEIVGRLVQGKHTQSAQHLKALFSTFLWGNHWCEWYPREWKCNAFGVCETRWCAKRFLLHPQILQGQTPNFPYSWAIDMREVMSFQSCTIHPFRIHDPIVKVVWRLGKNLYRLSHVKCIVVLSCICNFTSIIWYKLIRTNFDL